MTELDHVSLAVPGDPVAWAAGHGLSARRSPGHPNHSRVLLDGHYLEVTRGPSVAAPLLFLRDVPGLGEPQRYEGVDGVWLDSTLDVPGPLVVIATRRIEPPGPWPPARGDDHPCGARSIATVHVAGPAAALEPYAATCSLALHADDGGLRITAVDLLGGPSLPVSASRA